MQGKRKFYHSRHFGLVARRHYGHIRNHAEVGEIEKSVVSCAVLSDKTGSVNEESDRQVLKGDIMDDVVESAL